MCGFFAAMAAMKFSDGTLTDVVQRPSSGCRAPSGDRHQSKKRDIYPFLAIQGRPAPERFHSISPIVWLKHSPSPHSHVGRQQGRKDCRNGANASSGPVHSVRLTWRKFATEVPAQPASACCRPTSHVGRQQDRKDFRNRANASSGPAHSVRLTWRQFETEVRHSHRLLILPAFLRRPATRSQSCRNRANASSGPAHCSPNLTTICDRNSGTASVCSLLTRISRVGRQQGRKDCRNSANPRQGQYTLSA